MVNYQLNPELDCRQLYDFICQVAYDFPTPLSQKTDLHLFAEKLCLRADMVCATEGEELVGIIAGYLSNSISDIGYASILVVRREYRGLGIGKKLMQEFLAAAEKSENLKAVDLYAQNENTAAINCYVALGFQKYCLQNEPRPDDLHLIKYLKGKEA